MSVASPIFCPAVTNGQALGVGHALASVNCHVGLLVSGSYGGLLGANSVFGTVLTALLTLHVGFIALGPLAGPQMAAALIWLSGMLILLASAGALVLGSVGGGSGAPGVALQNQIETSPTVRVMQGTPIQVFAARDLDFSDSAQ